MNKQRHEARGKECMIRVPGVCNGDNETTVLAHYRLGGTCGYGMKPDDEQGAWACSACHDAVDGRISTPATEFYSNDDLRLMHAEGVFRTQYARRHGVE